jgi:hypothetical protein
MLTFYMVRPLLGCFQLFVVFDVVRFRCCWILLFWDMYSLVRWELFHMCYSVSVGEFLLHVGYSVVLELGRWNSIPRALLRFGRWILLHVGYSGVLIGYHVKHVEFSGTWDLSISLVLWLCFFKVVYCTWLSIIYSHLFFLLLVLIWISGTHGMHGRE